MPTFRGQEKERNTVKETGKEQSMKQEKVRIVWGSNQRKGTSMALNHLDNS